MGETPTLKQRFLVIDHHVLSATGIRALLQDVFPEVVGDIAYSLQDAMTLLYHNRYAFVIIDPYVFSVDCAVAAERVITLNAFGHGCPAPARMLIISADYYVDVLHWIPQGNHLIKPPSHDELIEKIEGFGFKRAE